MAGYGELVGALRQARAALVEVERALGFTFPAWSRQAQTLRWIDELVCPETTEWT